MKTRKVEFYLRQEPSKPRELPGKWKAFARNDDREVETFETFSDAKEWLHGTTDKPEKQKTTKAKASKKKEG